MMPGQDGRGARLALTFARGGLPAAGWVQGRAVEIEGWLCAFSPGTEFTYLALVDELPCCLGCLPREAERRIEVFAESSIPAIGGKVTLAGELHHLPESDPAGWRYQLRRARLVASNRPTRHARLDRRRMLATAAAASLTCAAVGAAVGATPGACAPSPPSGGAASPDVLGAAAAAEAARAILAGVATIDVHSHAGRVTGVRRVEEHAPFAPVAAPMREGGMAAICLAAVSDAPTHRIMPERRIRPFRDPAPGELYAYGQLSFQRIHDLAREQGLAVIATAADLESARSDGRPSIVVSAEGGDFLEGQPDRVAEAHGRWMLRHFQLTHYRVNELGDIQTEAPVHGGLTAMGAEVVRRCNRLGVVVDVAHGTYELVKQAAAVTTKPLVLSHTSLANGAPRPRSRLISADHARAVADTGGIVGVWPPMGIFPDMPALAAGIARMVDAVGIDHVALGTDLGGLVGPATFASYRDLPALCAALLARGFQSAEVRKLLGGNYLRVFAASAA